MTMKTLAFTLIAITVNFAKAEPVVYFCNTTNYAQVTDEKVGNIRSYPLKLFVDLEQGKVKISGDVLAIEIEDGASIGRVRAWRDAAEYGQDAFFAHDPSHLLDFQNGQLASTSILKLKDPEEFIISSYLASCEKF